VTVPETAAARRAALLVHALPPAKRRQLMARLGHPARARLQPLVDELVALGVPAASGLWLSKSSGSNRPVEAEARADARARAARLDAARVAECLRSCEPVTVARILQSSDWPWRAAMLSQLPDERRDAVLKHLGSDAPPLAPAMLEALCAQLCDLAERPGSGPVHRDLSKRTGATAWPRRALTLLRRLSAWLR